MADEQEKERLEAVRLAGEWNKQLGFWATGTIALSLTFLKDVVGESGVSGFWRGEIVFAWLSLIASLLFGHFAFGAPLTGFGRDDNWRLEINNLTRKNSIGQIICFIIGLVGIISFAAFHLPGITK